MKFAERGEVNRDLVRIVRANVREPNQVVGDFYSLAACNDVGHRRLVDMMQEIGLDSLDALATFIFSRTHAATSARIAALPKGRWTNTLVTDGYDSPVKLAAAVEIAGDSVNVDFTGTDGDQPLGHQRAHHLHEGLCLLRAEMRGGARHPEQLGVAGVVHHLLARQHPQRATPGAGQRCGM